MTREIDLVTVKKAYARWAPVYDLVFGALFRRGRQAAIAAAEQVGGRVLEVGVGTGISLPGYSSQTRIVGIDLSEPMLRKAQARVAELSLKNVERLEVMDAEHLSFPDASFDVVVAHYVVSTVPHPEVALDEFRAHVKAGWRDRLNQPRRRGRGFATRGRTTSGAAGSPSWLAYRVSLDAICTVDRSSRRYALGRTPSLPPFGHFSLLRFAKS
jgi:phosphatidylethanolamine/phosphatidyl-N-methylethanolamine N-methyltransferase